MDATATGGEWSLRSPVRIRRPEVGIVYAQPNPTPLAQLIRSESTVSGHRNLYCFHYDACLDVAVKLDWDSWSCEKCPLFAEHEAPRDFAGVYANERRGGVQP
jgi:hypothetical protein